ncbi:MAG: aldehyde dehydrogenase family protein [Pseudomonadota bacterium]
MVKILECISPIDGSVYARRQTLSPTQARHVVAQARLAQKKWAEKSIGERVSLVQTAVAKVGETTDRMAEELAHQMGRPVRYGGEFEGFEERANHMAKIAEEALAPMIIEDSDRFVRKIVREPQGVVFVIAPWNYPYMTAINTIAPALIAGNTVILKHATQTLRVGERLVEAFNEAGIPEAVFQNVFLDHETTLNLIGERSFDFVNFTGSLGGGKAIERAAAGTFTAVSTELGGKDPGYVMEDANLDQAIETLIDGAMFNAGQCCCGIERIYVHEHLYEDFVEKAVALVNTYKLGNPLDTETTIGPMANVRFADEVRQQISEAIADGAKTHIKTFAKDDGRAYLTPQILTNVTHKMRIMQDESFGPVVGIMKVTNDQEAINLMNDSPFGLTASLWTSDINRAQKIGNRLETGTVFMNRCDYLDPALCWTGCKDTGRGAGLSVLGFHALTRPKSYHLRKI